MRYSKQDLKFLNRKFLKHDSRANADIFTVNGTFVRGPRVDEPDFAHGGHWLVFPDTIPRREIWLDQAVPRTEWRALIEHEVDEVIGMEAGNPYEKAHEHATDVERPYRPQR